MYTGGVSSRSLENANSIQSLELITRMNDDAISFHSDNNRKNGRKNVLKFEEKLCCLREEILNLEEKTKALQRNYFKIHSCESWVTLYMSQKLNNST